MRTEDDCRRRADTLLKLAASSDNMRTRSDLIDQAARWHALALEAHEHDQQAPPGDKPAR
jgi:hypothetical protein